MSTRRTFVVVMFFFPSPLTHPVPSKLLHRNCTSFPIGTGYLVMASKPTTSKVPSSPSNIEMVQSAAETVLGVVLTLLRIAGSTHTALPSQLSTYHAVLMQASSSSNTTPCSSPFMKG